MPVFLKSARALLQVPHRKFTPGSCGDSSSRVPKQGNRSSETARNFLRSALRLLKFFPQTEHLKTSFLHSIIEIISIKTKYRSGDAILFSAITTVRLSSHAPARAEFHPVVNSMIWRASKFSKNFTLVDARCRLNDDVSLVLKLYLITCKFFF